MAAKCYRFLFKAWRRLGLPFSSRSPWLPPSFFAHSHRTWGEFPGRLLSSSLAPQLLRQQTISVYRWAVPAKRAAGEETVRHDAAQQRQKLDLTLCVSVVAGVSICRMRKQTAQALSGIRVGWPSRTQLVSTRHWLWCSIPKQTSLIAPSARRRLNAHPATVCLGRSHVQIDGTHVPVFHHRPKARRRDDARGVDRQSALTPACASPRYGCPLAVLPATKRRLAGGAQLRHSFGCARERRQVGHGWDDSVRASSGWRWCPSPSFLPQ